VNGKPRRQKNWERNMSAHYRTLRINLACIMLAAGLALPAGLGISLAAEQPSPEDIIRALKPARITRGLTVSPGDAARRADEARFVNTLRNRPTRSLTTAERDQIVSIAQKRPSIDLEVNFEYNSDAIGPKATPQVTALGQALSSADLKGGTFIVAGHTDGKGGDAYNQGLSERRANAVRDYVVSQGVNPAQITTVGKGESEPTDDNSTAEGRQNNRRVVIRASR
jgi:outer membrane protein OmpA-like peptidoglycan-associated protein